VLTHGIHLLPERLLREKLEIAERALAQYREGDQHAAAEEFIAASAHYDEGDKLREQVRNWTPQGIMYGGEGGDA